MAKLRMEDNCLEPATQITLTLKTKDPVSIYKEIKSKFREMLAIGWVNVWERKIFWDMSSDPRSFYFFVYFKQAVDPKSYILYEIIANGNQPSQPDVLGKIELKISAKLITEFNLKTAFQKSSFYKGLIWIYFYVFYRHARRNYIIKGKENVDKLVSYLKERLGFRPA